MPEYLTFLITLIAKSQEQVQVSLKVHVDRLPPEAAGWRCHGGHTTKELQFLVSLLPDHYSEMTPKKYTWIHGAEVVEAAVEETNTEENKELA